jgi:hypothetical protein
VAPVLRLLLSSAVLAGVAAPAFSQDRLAHFGPKAAAMAGAFTALADDPTAFYWNPAGYAFGPAFAFGVAGGDSDMNRGDGATFSEKPWAFALGLPFLAVAGTFSDASSSTIESGDLASRGLGSFDLSVSVVQSLPLPDLVIAGTVHYLRGESRELLESLDALTAEEQSPSAIRDRLASIPGESSSTASFDLGALYQPRDWIRLGMMWRRLTEPGFELPTGGEIVLSRHGRAGVAFFLPRGTTFSFDADLSSQGSDEDPFRELSFGVEQRWFGRALSLRAGLRAETGSDRGARPAFSAGIGVKVRFVVAEIAYEGSDDSRDESLWFGMTLRP